MLTKSGRAVSESMKSNRSITDDYKTGFTIFATKINENKWLRNPVIGSFR